MRWPRTPAGRSGASPPASPSSPPPGVWLCRCLCGSLDGSIYGLDLARGEFRWRVETGGPVVASAVLDGGCAYVGTTGGRFLAIDLATGERVWEVPHGGRVSATATLTVDRVYYGALDGAVYCLDRATGAVVWSYVLGKPLTGAAALTPAGDLLLIGGTDGKIHALATGELPPADDCFPDILHRLSCTAVEEAELAGAW